MNLKIIVLIFLVQTNLISTYDIFPKNHEFVYKINGQILLIPDAEKEHPNVSNDNTQWALIGNLIIQHCIDDILNVKIELDPSYHPVEPATNVLMEQFHIKLQNETVQKIYFHKDELDWSKNIKRAVAALLQVHGDGVGAFVDETEQGLYGTCPTEYFVVNDENTMLITKSYNMDSCSPFFGYVRSNLPHNFCQQEKQTQVITSRIASYSIEKTAVNHKYLLKEIDSTMRTNVQTFEAYYPQFLFSQIVIKHVSHKLSSGTGAEAQMTANILKEQFEESGLRFVYPFEATGGRSPKNSDQLVKRAATLLNQLADSLEATQLNFNEPYDGKVSEIIRLMETMDLKTLKILFAEIDIGTSYRQETARNLLLEIIPRTGTAATVLFTRDLVVDKQVKPTIAVQLMMALPFYIAEPSQELIKECESFLNLGPDWPDVKHIAVLSYATMIYKTFIAGKLQIDMFEKYVKNYFDRFLNSFDYEQQMLYLQALGNLQLGNVAEYLEPIIKADYPQTTDIRFLAIWATMPTAHLRPEKVFEIYWPIFYSKSTPLQLRVAAFTMLLLSNPTPGRLLGLYEVVKNEDCPHMINFYWTTVMSISETTYSCYQHLKRLLSYMTRTLPLKPQKKYWTTGNYIFDYRDRKFQIGAVLQTLLIGDQKTDLPLVAYIKFDTEALGKFTGQLGIYVKARGLTNAVIERLAKYNADDLEMSKLSEILSAMKLPKHSSNQLHLEFIVQVEGKAVISYYLNQTTFHKLTDGDLINRINLLLRADSHINMQILRRPFMIKYGLPTLLGTSSHILIESTVIGTLRGNTTQLMTIDKITRNNQIDLRYSSYAVAKLQSYNPIEDIEYNTIREQGFLIYFPMHNEIMLNITSKSLVFGFFRPENLTSGISLKSRTRNQPYLGGLWSAQPQQDKNIQSYKYHIEDIGLDVLLGINEEYATENFMFMLEADILNNIKVFSKSPFSVVHEILTLTSLVQLNSIHIGRDKHMTLLLNNPQKTKIEGIIRLQSEDLTQTLSSKENLIYKIDCSMSHKTDTQAVEGKTLHKWDWMAKYTTYKNSTTHKIMLSFARKLHNGQKWKICISESHDAFVFLKRPFASSSSTIVFGDLVAKNCPNDKSRIDVNLSYKLPRDTASLYLDYKSKNEEACPKEIILLTPPPFTPTCGRDEFEEITRISSFDARFKFEKMPDGFTNIANRIDHLISALLPQNLDRLNISNDFKISIEKSTKDSDTAISINGNQFTVPLKFDIDSKLSTQRQMAIDYGFINLCSLIGRQLNTFYDIQTELNDEIISNFTYESTILLAADCSEQPKFALFVEYYKTNNNKNKLKEVKIYTGGNYLTYSLENQNKDSIKIVVNGKDEVNNINKESYTYPPYEQYFDFKVSINDDDIFVYENTLMSIVVQFNMEKILSIQVPTYHKSKMCGLCGINNNLELKYTMN